MLRILFSSPEMCFHYPQYRESLKSCQAESILMEEKWKHASIINKKQNSKSRVHINIEGYLHNFMTSRYLQIKQLTLSVSKVKKTKMIKPEGCVSELIFPL